MKKIKIKDIAKLANTSPTAVSLVLNNKECRISKEKRNLIIKIAEENNYKPSYIAKSLVSNRTYTIGLIIPDIENLYFAKLSKHIQLKLQEKGYMLLIANSDDSEERDRYLINCYKNSFADGLIICMSAKSYTNPSFKAEILDKLDIPYVLTDRIFDEKKNNQVSFDNQYGGYKATNYLIQKGFKKIACITGKKGDKVSDDRFKGYCKALSENKIKLDNALVIESDFKKAPIDKMLNEEKIDAIFACNDLMAYDALSKLIKQKKQNIIPIVGYDGLQQSDNYGYPIISIYQDLELLAEHTIDILLKQIEKGEETKTLIIKPTIKKI